MKYQTMLDTVQTLMQGLSRADGHERKELYGAVQVLLVQLVDKLERHGCEDEVLYERCGEVLDHCSHLAGMRRLPAGRERVRSANLAVRQLRSGLAVQALAS